MNWFGRLKMKWQEAREEAQSPKISLNTAQAVVPNFFNLVDQIEEEGMADIADADAVAAEANKILAKATAKRARGTRRLNAVKRVRKASGVN